VRPLRKPLAVLASGAAVAAAAGLALAGGGQQGSTQSPQPDLVDQFSAWQAAAQRENPGWRDQARRWRGPTWRTLERPRRGLVEVSKPFPSSLYLLAAFAWQDWRAGWLTLAYAGVLTQDRAQGIVIVRESPHPLRYSLVPEADEPPDRTRTTLYKTPIRSGSVRITGANGDVLTLVSSKGRHLTFDVGERAFELGQTETRD
jgi:hypothetical protein